MSILQTDTLRNVNSSVYPVFGSETGSLSVKLNHYRFRTEVWTEVWTEGIISIFYMKLYIQSTLDTTNFDIMNFTIQQIFGMIQIILY